MFTGIVEEVGLITEFEKRSERAIKMSIKAKKVLEDTKIGDSISVNGICLTIKEIEDDQFSVDVMPETVKATSLKQLTINLPVNLERSLKVNDRLGGHFVTGHVDGIGQIVNKEKCENAIYYDLAIKDGLMPYMIMKGSIAVDGVSLTIFKIEQEKSEVTVSLIPHTLKATILGEKQVGDPVNIECDVMAKHIKNQLQHYLHNINEGELNVSYD